MEVHHHTHNSIDSHREKRWHHYFWEFFMLFLAVTLGFFVENRREVYIEHLREKEFAPLLYADLKKDTTWLHRIIKIKKWRGAKIDSLFYLVSQPDLSQNAAQIYYYSMFLTVDLPFRPNDATIQQLRNSGSLRYFTNLQLYNKITVYYKDCDFYFEREKERKADFSTALRSRIFKADEFSSLRGTPVDIMDAISRPKEKMQLLPADKQTINEFLHFIDDARIANGLSIMLLQNELEGELNSLIESLKKEFHLE